MATPGCTLTYKIDDITGAGKAGKVTMTLVNYGTVPQILNTSVIADTYYPSDAASDGTGTINFFGNYQFTFPNSYYVISVYGTDSEGKINVTPTWTAPYVFTAGGSYDLGTIDPVTAVPGAPITTGFIGVTAVNGILGGVTIAGGTDITVTPSGQTLTIAFAGDLSFAGVSAGTNTGQLLIVGNGSELSYQGTGIINASAIGGFDVGSTNPNTGQVLTWNGSEWLPADAAGGTSVDVNGSPVSNPNFNASTPSAPGGTSNIVFQTDGSGNVSAYYTTSGTAVPFSSVESGTNTTAAMVVGSGATLGVSGGGTITATGLAGTPSITVGTVTATALSLSSGDVASWNSDTGISRDSAGVVDIGNGSAGSRSGTVNATTANFTGTATVGTLAATTIDGAALSGTFSGNPAFSGNVKFGSGLLDQNGSAGSNGYVLSSTGGAIQWIAAPNLPFSSITSGTNLGQTLTVGAASTLTYSTGTINANQIGGNAISASAPPATGQALVWSGSGWAPSNAANFSFAGVQSGTNVSATMTVGSGGTLGFVGSGVVNANEIQGVAVSATAPTAGQVLTAINNATASWQTPGSNNLWSQLGNPTTSTTLNFGTGGNTTLFEMALASGTTQTNFFEFENTTPATSSTVLHAPGATYAANGWNGSASAQTTFTTDFRCDPTGQPAGSPLSTVGYTIFDVNNAQTLGQFAWANNMVCNGTVTSGSYVNAASGYKVNGAAATGHFLIGNGTEYVDGGPQISFAVSGSNSELSVGTTGGVSNGVLILGSSTGGGAIQAPGTQPLAFNATTFDFNSLGFVVNTSITQRLNIDSTGAWNLNGTPGAGSSGQVLTSQGTGTPPVWANVSGSGTVNSGTAGQMAYYATSTNAVSGTPDATISGGALSLGVSETTAGSLVLYQGTTNTDAITISAAGATASYTLTLPATGGTSGYALTTNGSGTTSWSSVLTNPMTTTGDIIYSSSGSTPARLGIGTTGYVLTVVGGVPAWASNTGGSAFSAITAGTNTAALVEGSSGSITTSGTGLIQATNAFNLINVKTKGAVGDGSTNDHTDIQAAFTGTGTSFVGVYFPESGGNNYVNSSAVTDPTTGDLQFIYGDGDLTSVFTSGTNNLLTLTHVTDNTSVNGFRMENLSFQGNTTPTSVGTQVLVALSNANSNSSGGDVSGLQLKNVQFVNSAGPGLTIDQPILANIQNVTCFGNAQGIVYTNTGTTVTQIGTYMNSNLAAGYTFEGQQCIACIGTAMDSNGTGYDFNGASCIGMMGIDGESSVAWQQSITTVALTSNVATITVANTYGVGDTVLITGGTSTNAVLNGRWKVATRSSSQFTFATSGFSNISSNNPSGMKSSVECGDLIRMRVSSVGLCVNGIQCFTPGIAQSALMLVDGTSGLVSLGGYINNSAGLTHDVITMPGAGGMFYHSCNFGATTEANAIYAAGIAANNGGGGANYVGINNTFGNAQITPPIMVHVVYAGNPAPATAGMVIENGTAFATSIPALTLTQHNAGDTGNVLTINNSGTSSTDITATNWVMGQSGKLSKYGGQATSGQGVAPILNSVQVNNQTANYNSGSAKTLVTPTVSGQTFRVTAMQAISQAATSSSTLPSLTVGWTDSTAVARTLVLLATSTANATTVYETGTCLVTTNASTPVTVTSASYASSGATTMDYNLTVAVEQII